LAGFNTSNIVSSLKIRSQEPIEWLENGHLQDDLAVRPSQCTVFVKHTTGHLARVCNHSTG